VNCAAVRDAMPEFALGVSSTRATAEVELHVETCAACRKEAIDLQRAVAAFGYAVAPAEPPSSELEERVVGAVHDIATPKPRSHNVRRAGITLLAAALVVGALGVGAVLANRANLAERSRLQAERTQLETQIMLQRFGDVVSSARFADPDTNVYLGSLSAIRGRGTGAALTVVSPSAARDQVIVIVSGLPVDGTPFTVSLHDPRGHALEVGTIRHLDTSGGATFARRVAGGLDRYVDVVVRSADSSVVLRGTLTAGTSLTSPSP
jgi:anti-sigma-K factor RskA